MNSEEFGKLDASGKWNFISQEMEGIAALERVHEFRKRLNPHHSKAQQREEAENIRKSQYIRWVAIKELYTEYRDDLVDTLNDERHTQFKSILERILVQDFDNELRKIIK